MEKKLAKTLTGIGFGVVLFYPCSTLVAKFSLKQLQIPNKTRTKQEANSQKKTTIWYKSDNLVQMRQLLIVSAFPGRMFVLRRIAHQAVHGTEPDFAVRRRPDRVQQLGARSRDRAGMSERSRARTGPR